MSRHVNLWEETAIAAPARAPLVAPAETEVAVIGAGYLGLSAALHLAENGRSVTVLEANTVGFGASGRNGGQVIPGLKYDPDELEAMLGAQAGRRLWQFAGGTAQLVFSLIARHRLEAGARPSAWVQGIHSQKAAERALSRAEQWQKRGADVLFVDRAGAARITGTDLYVGAFVDRRAGAVQPLSYARGLAAAAAGAGAVIHEQTRVTQMQRRGAGWRIMTEAGHGIDARDVLVCTNGYSGALLPQLPRSIVAANSLQIATEPLSPALRAGILPGGEVVSDTRKVIRYWRLDDAGRLLMGGRGPYREPGPERDWAHLIRDVATLYPALKDVRFTHRWGGRIAIHPDYLPHLHRPDPGVIVAIGCQGRGIGWQTAMGAELCRMIVDPDHDPVLPVRAVAPIPFAPLKRIGVSATITMLRLADRLGLT